MKTSAKNQEFNSELLLNSMFSGVSNPANAVAVMEMLDKFGLNWNVHKLPLLLPNGRPSGHFGIVREDTGTCFQSCKDTYTPFQNSELAEMLIRISEKTGYKMHAGGSFKGGAKVFIQLESPNKIKGIGENNDKVNGFLTGLNSHDGSTAMKWGETNITISCQNKFYRAMDELKQSARHTISIHQAVEQGIRTLAEVVEAEKNLFKKFKELSEIPVTSEAIAQVVKRVTKVDITEEVAEKLEAGYRWNRSQELLTSINTEMAQKGETMWGLLSGVTHYSTHVMKAPKRDNGKLESIYSGKAYRANNRSFNIILDSLN